MYHFDGLGKAIRLGKATARQAESFKVKLEALIAARLTGGIDDEVCRWVAALPDDMHAKLARLGLADPRAGETRNSRTLAELLNGYLKDRDDLKPNTRRNYGQTRRMLIEFFGPDKRLADMTEYDAEEWQRSLARRGLAKATIRKRSADTKMFFKVAIRQRLIASNPFDNLKSTSVSNDERLYFVGRQETRKVLDACPDTQWRCIFALARFAGFRTPSETLLLRWQDVNWAEDRMLVWSPKTEHHEGKDCRAVPIFPELRPHLVAVFEEAEPGTEHVITRYRQSNSNLRTQFKRILKRAGVKPWPRIFQNLRSSRETELAETFPLHVVTAWMGNSQAIAARHYLQVTDEHYRQAAKYPTGTNGAAQNPAQQAHEINCTTLQGATEGNSKKRILHAEEVVCKLTQALANRENADERSRTSTGRSPQAPEACASANSATSAWQNGDYG